MKNYLALVLVAFLLASCSQQQFAFRKKIAVKQPDLSAVQNYALKKVDSITSIEAGNKITYSEPLPFVKQHDALTAEEDIFSPDDTIRKKYKFDDDKRPNNPNSGSDPKGGSYDLNDRADKDALIGFILSLVGLLILQPVAIAGLIYSIRGLKSFKRKGLAIAGIIISALVILLMLFLLFVFIMLILAFAG